jgi:hypothetical protein
MGIELLIGTGIAIAGGSAISSGKRASDQRRAARDKEAELEILEANRQDIPDPYSNIKDLSNKITNPFSNLQVATKAAEFKAEQTDISLASTLDTLRATGAGSSGATALAQAALRSKQGIAASIEKQEAQNSRLRAQGEQSAQQRRLGEAIRMQSADVASQQFQFSAREGREMQQLNRVAGLAQGYRSAAAASQAGMYGALGSLGGGLMSMGAGMLPGNNSAGSGNINTDVNIEDGFIDSDFYDVDGMQINQMGGSTDYYNLNNINSEIS